MWRLWLVLALTLPAFGCSHLVIKHDDNVAEATAKVLTRIVLGVPTLGISERFVADARDVIEAERNLSLYRDRLEAAINDGMISPERAAALYAEYRQELAEQIVANREARAEAIQAMGTALQNAGQGMSGGGYGYSSLSPPMPLFPPGTPSRNFTVTDTMTGRVSSGNVSTMPNGSQSYMYTTPNGRTETGFVGPPMGGMRNYQFTNPQTGQTQFGTISTFPSK